MLKKVAYIAILSLTLTHSTSPQPTELQTVQKTRAAKKPLTLDEIRARNGSDPSFWRKHRRKLVILAALAATGVGVVWGAQRFWPTPATTPKRKEQITVLEILPKDIKEELRDLHEDLMDKDTLQPMTSFQVPDVTEFVRTKLLAFKDPVYSRNNVVKLILNFVYPKKDELPAALELLVTLAPKGEPVAFLKERQDFLIREYKKKRETELASVYKNHQSMLDYVKEIQSDYLRRKRMAEVAGISPEEKARRMRELGYLDVTKRAQPRKLHPEQYAEAEYLEDVSQRVREERTAKLKREATAELSREESKRLFERFVNPTGRKRNFKRPVHEAEYAEGATVRDMSSMKKAAAKRPATQTQQDPQVLVDHSYLPVPEAGHLVIKGKLGSAYSFFREQLGQTDDSLHKRYTDSIMGVYPGQLFDKVEELFIRRYAHKTPEQSVEDIARLVKDKDVDRLLIQSNKAGQLAKDISNTKHGRYWYDVGFGKHPYFEDFKYDAQHILSDQKIKRGKGTYVTVADIKRLSDELTEEAKTYEQFFNYLKKNGLLNEKATLGTDSNSAQFFQEKPAVLREALAQFFPDLHDMMSQDNNRAAVALREWRTRLTGAAHVMKTPLQLFQDMKKISDDVAKISPDSSEVPSPASDSAWSTESKDDENGDNDDQDGNYFYVDSDDEEEELSSSSYSDGES